MVVAARLLGGFLINSSTVMDTSLHPSWLLCAKCALTGLSMLTLLISPRCAMVKCCDIQSNLPKRSLKGEPKSGLLQQGHNLRGKSNFMS